MLDQLLNYLNSNGGLLVILCLVVTIYVSGNFFRQFTPQRASAEQGRRQPPQKILRIK